MALESELTVKEIEEEITAFKEVTKAHEAQLNLNMKGVKANKLIIRLLENEVLTRNKKV